MDALILNIESSTTLCSVSLGKNGHCLDHRSFNEGYSHAEKLAPFIADILAANNLKASDLDAIAVSSGPGSYTGLRIGHSLAKGLCFSASKPLISVPTLQLMCLNKEVRAKVNFYKDVLLCPMLDARRMEVYTCTYDIGLKEVSKTQAKILDEESFRDELAKEAVLFFGPGSEKVKTVVDSKSAYYVEDVWPSAEDMCLLSQTKFEAQEFEDVAYCEPFYLKEFMTTTPKKLI
jgi:tRNA threonylcarbamoyladenosine biosynthesis protein TsaB